MIVSNRKRGIMSEPDNNILDFVENGREAAVGLKLADVKIVNVDEQHLFDFLRVYKYLTNIKTLTFIAYTEVVIPKEIFSLRTLRTINIISEYPIRNLDFSSFEKLEKIKIIFFKSREYFEDIIDEEDEDDYDEYPVIFDESSITNSSYELILPESIKRINLEKVRINSFLSCISSYQELVTLKLNKCEYTIREIDLCSLDLLKTVNIVNLIRDKCYVYIPFCVKNISLENIMMDYFLDDISQYNTLEKLELRKCNIEVLPSDIGQLKNLQSLDLWSNKLMHLPESLFTLKNLKLLHVGGNELNGISSSLSDLENLQILQIWGCNLDTVPKEVFNLKKLRLLNLSNNNIEVIPDEIFTLSNLEYLYIFNCEIKLIPIGFSQLKKLETLRLGRNQIEKIPNELFYSDSIKSFDVTDNSICEIYNSVLYNNSIEELKIDNNPIVNPPLEVTVRGIKAIKKYFSSVQRLGSTKLYEAKMLLVGQGEVGKTCIAKKLVNNRVCFNDSELSTEGIDIKKWNVSYKGNGLDINLWDFGGQEIYHATHQFFLTKRSVYCFIWDARKEEEQSRFEYWLNTINILGSNSPVLVVMNKSDQRYKHIDEAELLKRFPNIVSFHKVSCLSNDGFKQMKDCILNEVNALPQMGMDWPNSWANLKMKIEKNSSNYITYTEFKQLCIKSSVAEEEVEVLADLLHDLGKIIFFKNDPYLNDLVILNPEWVTHAVYKAYDDNDIVKSNGIFNVLNFFNAWNDKQYPREKHLTILRLMSKFEICFNIPNTDSYILPELLSYNEPTNELTNQIPSFIYEYDFLMSGIMNRFICKVHELIYNDIYWKNGVVICKDNTCARISLDVYNKKISIQITGVMRRELLGIIRGHFDSIHISLNNLKVKESIPCTCVDCNECEDVQYFEMKMIKKYLEKGRSTIVCRNAEVINISSLLGGSIINSFDNENGDIGTYLRNTVINNIINKTTNINGNQNNGGKIMKIDSLVVNGGQVNVADSIGTVNMNPELKQDLLSYITSLPKTEETEEILSLINNNSNNEQSMKDNNVIDKVKSFLLKHGAAIAGSTAANLLIELGTQTFAG